MVYSLSYWIFRSFKAIVNVLHLFDRTVRVFTHFTSKYSMNPACVTHFTLLCTGRASRTLRELISVSFLLSFFFNISCKLEAELLISRFRISIVSECAPGAILGSNPWGGGGYKQYIVQYTVCKCFFASWLKPQENCFSFKRIRWRLRTTTKITKDIRSLAGSWQCVGTTNLCF